MGSFGGKKQDGSGGFFSTVVPGVDLGSQHQRGSLWALATVSVVSAGGFGFWVLAAALSESADDVGRAAAWFTLMQLLSLVVGLGGPILINRTGSRQNRSDIAGSAAMIIIGSATLLGLFAPLVAGPAWRELSGISGLALGPFVAIAAAGNALTLAVDARYLSLRRWQSVFLRNTVPATVRMPLLLLDPFDDRATWIIAIAIVPLSASGIVALVLLVREGEISLRSPKYLPAADRRFLLIQHLGAVAIQAPYHIVPLMVARRVASPTNAAFYLVWSIGVMIALLPQTLTQVLLSETSLKTAGRLRRIQGTMIANLALVGAAWLATIVLARPALNLIGPDYGDIAPVLPWIVLSAAALAVTSICLTEARLAQDGPVTALVAATLATISIGLGWLLIEQRAVWGATISWLIANLIAMVVGIVALDRSMKKPVGAITLTANTGSASRQPASAETTRPAPRP